MLFIEALSVFYSDVSSLRKHHQVRFFKYGPDVFVLDYESPFYSEFNDV